MTTDAEFPDALAKKLGCRDPHKGHRYFHGGIRDGEVDHMVYAHESDYPKAMGTLLRHGQRSYYEIDPDRSVGTEVVYKFVGFEPPQSMVEAAARRAAREQLAKAAALVIETQFGSPSMLRRKMNIDVDESLRLMNQLEERGIVGPEEGTHTRDVLLRPDELDNLLVTLRGEG